MYLTWRNQACHIYNYLQEHPKKITGFAQDVVKLDTGSIIVGQQLGAGSVRQKHMQLKPAESMQILLGTTQLRPAEGRHQYRNREGMNHLEQTYQCNNNHFLTH